MKMIKTQNEKQKKQNKKQKKFNIIKINKKMSVEHSCKYEKLMGIKIDSIPSLKTHAEDFARELVQRFIY